MEKNELRVLALYSKSDTKFQNVLNIAIFTIHKYWNPLVFDKKAITNI